MVFSKKEILLPSVSFVPTASQPLGCGVFQHKTLFDKPQLDKDQKIQFSRIFIRIDVINRGFLPPTFANPIVKIKYNGLTKKQFTFNEIPDSGILEFEMTNRFKNNDNSLFIEFDFACLNIEFIAYADLYYQLNTNEPPINEDINQGEETNEGDPFEFPEIPWLEIGAGVAIIGGVLLFTSGFGKGLGRGVGSR